MNVTALLTAKANSTYPRKNLQQIEGHPLVWYPAYIAKHSSRIQHFYVSSDSEEILDVTGELGFRAIKRPKNLAQPDTLHVDAIRHALEFMEHEDGLVPDILIVLLGNTVSFKRSWIDFSIDMLQHDPSLSAVTPVYIEQDHHPFRARKLDQQGHLVPYFDFSTQKLSSNRQDLPQNMFFCHNFWTLRLLEGKLSEDGYPPWDFMGHEIYPLVVDRTVDVHHIKDLDNCRDWLRKNEILD